MGSFSEGVKLYTLRIRPLSSSRASQKMQIYGGAWIYIVRGSRTARSHFFFCLATQQQACIEMHLI